MMENSIFEIKKIFTLCWLLILEVNEKLRLLTLDSSYDVLFLRLESVSHWQGNFYAWFLQFLLIMWRYLPLDKQYKWQIFLCFGDVSEFPIHSNKTTI